MDEPTVTFYRRPVDDPITGHFGEWYKRVNGVVVGTTAEDPAREWQHRGVDLGSVRAICVSPVSRTTRAVAPYNDGSFGIAVCLDHGDGWYSLYAHLAVAYVRPGDWVAPGQPIGISGNTGGVPYHLHWQLSDSWYFPTDIGRSRNPLAYMEEPLTADDKTEIQTMIADAVQQGVQQAVQQVVDAIPDMFRRFILFYFTDGDPSDFSDANGKPIPPDPKVIEALRQFRGG